MLVDITVYVVRLKDEILSASSVSDMYSEAQLRIDVDSPEYEYIKENIEKYSGDKHIRDNYILNKLKNNEPISLNGEAKDICISVGDFVAKLEYRQIPWGKA